VAYAEKWGSVLAELEGLEPGAYELGGEAYETLKEQYDIEINDDVWNRIFFGEITTSHKTSGKN
jgi:hypothetical protein